MIRFSIKKGMIFDKDGNFKINKDIGSPFVERLTNRLRGKYLDLNQVIIHNFQYIL